MYKVIPYHPEMPPKGWGQQVATVVEETIKHEHANGWEFVQLQELTTFVPGNSGCFGFGATPSSHVSMCVLIFKRA